MLAATVCSMILVVVFFPLFSTLIVYYAIFFILCHHYTRALALEYCTLHSVNKLYQIKSQYRAYVICRYMRVAVVRDLVKSCIY
jgi:hypothetical protein